MMQALKMSSAALALLYSITTPTNALDCDHVNFHPHFVMPVGVCLSKKTNEPDTGIKTSHSRLECKNEVTFLSIYDNEECSGNPKISQNYEQIFNSIGDENQTDLYITFECSTGKTCPYVKTREIETRDSVSPDCSVPPGPNDVYEDTAHVLDDCMSLTIPMEMNMDSALGSTRFECSNNVAKRSMWINNEECDGAAMMEVTGDVNDYIICGDEDKEWVLECSNGQTSNGQTTETQTDSPTSKVPTSTSKAPTSKVPTSKTPTSKAPTSKVPTSKAPTSKVPTSKTVTPISKAPTTKATTTQAPIASTRTKSPISSSSTEESAATKVSVALGSLFSVFIFTYITLF